MSYRSEVRLARSREYLAKNLVIAINIKIILIGEIMKFSSDRRFILYMILPVLIFFAVTTIILLVGMFISPHEIIGTFVFVLIFLIISILVLCYILLKPKPTFIFNENNIIIKKDNNIEEINIENISKMTYYRFRWFYIFILAYVPLPNGGCMKIHIIEKDDTKHQLGFISYKTAKRIQKLYPDLLKVD